MAARKAPGKTKVEWIADRYRVVKTLGHGGGGSVFLVQDLQEGDKLLALKRVDFTPGKSPPSIADLKNEFATLHALSHPHLAKVYDFGGGATEVYFTSEWIDGRDILAATREANLNTVFRLLMQVLRAVDYLHQRGVLHLDLKPANILVTDPDATGELKVKLIDFGISRWQKHGRTSSEGFFGTPPYAAPELIQEREASATTDIYAIGMILHQIFAGRFPFATQNPFEILMRQPFEEAERISLVDPALPAEFAAFLHRMVRRDPATRFANVAEVVAELNSLLSEPFSLRSPQAPAQILEESDYLFHDKLRFHLQERLLAGAKLSLNGAPGSGKSRLLAQLKAEWQLQGLAPWYFSQGAVLEEFLPQISKDPTRPVLWDVADLSTKDQVTLSDLPNACCVIASRETSKSFESVRIEPLSPADLKKFLRQEIHGVPGELLQCFAESYAQLTPRQLGEALQAFRESGYLAWSPSGWQWTAPANWSVSAALRFAEKQARAREQSTREMLESSGLTLPASALEGMQGLEAGSMAQELELWAHGDWLECELRQGVPHYRARRHSGAEVVENFHLEGSWLTEKLKELYDAGKFSAGVAWLDRISGEVSLGVALHGARHLVVEGLAERALAFLPKTLPSNPEEQGLYHEIRGNALRRLNRLAEAEAAANDAVSAYQAAVSKSGISRARILLGNLAKQSGDYPKATESFILASELAEIARDDYCAGFAQTNLALIHQERGEFTPALQSYRRAWDYAKRCRHPNLLQTLHHNWINLLYHMGRLNEAESACYEWLQLATRHGYRLQQAYALNYLALLAGQRGHRELQGAHLDQAIALLDPTRAPRFAAQFFVNRAFLKLSQGNFLAAQLDAEAALELGPGLAEDPVMNSVYLVLGEIFRDRKRPDYEKAAAFLSQAQAGASRQQQPQVLWEIEYHRGILEKRRGEAKKAHEHFQKALKILDEVVDKTPDLLKTSFLRDRKRERIIRELAGGNKD